MNKIRLNNLELKTFIEQNALDYCFLNNINPNDITELNLGFNKLTDISGIKLFKNTEKLWLDYNKLTDISVLKYLNNLKELTILNLELESDQIQYIKSLKNLEILYCYNGFKDMSVLKQINKNIKIYE